MPFREIAEYSDFVKPVVYNTVAGYRIHAYIRALCKSVYRGVDEQTVYDLHRQALGYDEACKFDDHRRVDVAVAALDLADDVDHSIHQTVEMCVASDSKHGSSRLEPLVEVAVVPFWTFVAAWLFARRDQEVGVRVGDRGIFEEPPHIGDHDRVTTLDQVVQNPLVQRLAPSGTLRRRAYRLRDVSVSIEEKGRALLCLAASRSSFEAYA
jgi:hypothetical protein